MDTLKALMKGRALARGDTAGRKDAVMLAQQLLHARNGAELLDDGVFGKQTEAAVRAYQAAHGLKVSGRIGTDTAKALDGDSPLPPMAVPLPSVKTIAPWLTTMRAITGEKEYPGSEDSPFVLGMAREIGKRFPSLADYCKEYSHDAIPWCGLTVAYVMAFNGICPVRKQDGASYGFLWADDWKYFGEPSQPRPGAVMVFTRAGGGHVSMYEDETPTHYIVRGGNQSDMVNVTNIAKEKFTTARWPKGL